ncbi:phosphatase PAP2 family protein [Sphingomonas cannabina]|uniref:phosphatase PAP2 family protein n=1 Tax=Sphingomonas cannabina TaxID=2899123 RepID=UPI001F3018B4|nr:phosphatase PAP2 family protein [Sphingomonas cannabina]UIJ46417.1 phosphatase PAP2 family protein [Sphingomonas cannabina]
MIEPLVPTVPPVRATRRPPWLLIAGALVAGALWLLFRLGSEVRAGEAMALDRSLMLAMRVPGHPELPAGPAWLAGAMGDVTALGGATVLTGVVVLTIVFLALKRLWRPALLVLMASLSGSWAVSALKAGFARPRPTLIDHLVEVSNASFPSGHAANSAIIYLTLASLLFPVVREARIRVFVLAVALLLTGAIGISRVYLGVHWPSDVLAGWLFGALWALMWWWIEARLLRRRL